MTSGRSLVLVGLMATGKSSVGRLIAERRGWPLLDSDDTVEERSGRTVREIWISDGEAAFRALESEALRDALARDEPAVIAAAGGVVLDAGNRQRLRDSDAVVVWLDAPVDVLVERVTENGHRPLLDDDPRGTLERMSAERRELYEEVADHTLDVDDLPPDVVADRILGLLG